MFGIGLIQRALGAIGTPAHSAFLSQLKNPELHQAKLAEELVQDLAKTEYGKSFGLKNGGMKEFQSRIPIADFASLQPWIKENRLFSDPVLFYERTSGSGGAVKYIPYTRKLKKVFERMAFLWITDIAKGPLLSSGKFFMSVSPAMQTRDEDVQLGIDSDMDYLSGFLKPVLSRFLVAPSDISRIQDPTIYRAVLACHLLAEEKLEIISIWNPTYLTALFDFISAEFSVLAPHLSAGKIENYHFRSISKKRMEKIKAQDWASLWPDLKWISTWADAGAETFARELQEIFPKAFVQPKGLLSTECPVTVPLRSANAAVPLVNDVLLEFLEENGNVRLLHEVEKGREYELVVSVRGGFSRYRLGDQVAVGEGLGKTPSLRFVGRKGGVSDLVGEKLDDSFVRETLNAHSGLEKDFWFLVPDFSARPLRYVLISRAAQIDAREADQLLQKSFHYRYARQLGQLGEVEMVQCADARNFYQNTFVARGMKWGDIKKLSLISRAEDAKSILERLASFRRKSL